MTFFTNVLYRLAQLAGAPFVNPDMLWIAVPLIVTLIIIEIYFGRYRGEKLGWNSAITNTLVLVFVSLNLFQYIFRSHPGNFFAKMSSTGFFVALLVFVLGVLLFFADFFHWLHKKIAFKISAHLPVNLTAYTAIVIVYNKVPVEWATIVAWLLLILVLAIIFMFVKRAVPKSLG